MTAVASLLSDAAGPELFSRIRQQKLLLRAPTAQRAAFVEILRNASRILSAVERENFGNYLTFALEVDVNRCRCIEQLHASFRGMPRCSKVDLLVASEEFLEGCSEKQFRLSNLSPFGISVAEYERRLHECPVASPEPLGTNRFAAVRASSDANPSFSAAMSLLTRFAVAL